MGEDPSTARCHRCENGGLPCAVLLDTALRKFEVPPAAANRMQSLEQALYLE